MIDIRRARLEELPLLRKVAIESFIETFAEHNTPDNMQAFLETAYHPDAMAKEWNEPGSVNLLAWDDHLPVGFARLRINNEVEEKLGKKTIELQRLYVHPGHQGKKIGSALMKETLKHCIQTGCDWLWLGVWERNFRAQEFYNKWGFEKFSEHVFLMGDDPQIDWLLKKRII